MGKTRVLIALAVGLFSCSEDNSVDPPKGTDPPAGTTLVAASQSISSAGGVLTVSDASSPLHGLVVSVPANAAPSGMKLDIGFTKVDAPSNAPGFAVASPLITITSTVPQPDSLLTITIPVNVPDGSFAVPVLYNHTTKTYEGLPMTAATATSVTVVTKGAGLNTASGVAARSLAGEPTSVFSIIALSINAKELAAKQVINTGFKPGTDDWEFVNYGSYLAPGGHCAGQSITAMWYYYEKALKSSPRLYHRFDLVNKDSATLWQDNPRGFRFASVVQADIQWDSWISSSFFYTMKNSAFHALSWKAFAATMLLTGEPQLVGLMSDSGGHAIIAHKISLKDSTLYVSDPNFPGREKQIKFAGDKFLPYTTMQNAAQDPYAYWGVGYFAKTALIDWAAIGKRYAELEKGTIGTVAPNAFPADTVKTFDGQKVVGDSLTSFTDSVGIEVLCPTCAASYSNSTRQPYNIYDTTGLLLADYKTGETSQGLPRGKTKFLLKPGRHRYGFAISGLIPIPGQAGSASINWLNFRWVTINNAKPKVKISPDAVLGETGKTYTFTATPTVNVPDAIYDWTVTNAKDSVIFSSLSKPNNSIQVPFVAWGVYSVKVRLYNADKSLKLDSTTAKVEIETKGAKSFSFTWKGKLLYSFDLPYSITLSGTVTGLDGNTIDSVFMYDFNPGVVHVYMPMFGNKKFQVQASISATLLKTVIDSTPKGEQRWRYSITSPAKNRITTSRLNPYYYAQSSSVDLTYTGDGDVIFEPYWSYKMETFDSLGAVVKTDTGLTSTTVSGVIQLEGN